MHLYNLEIKILKVWGRLLSLHAFLFRQVICDVNLTFGLGKFDFRFPVLGSNWSQHPSGCWMIDAQGSWPWHDPWLIAPVKKPPSRKGGCSCRDEAASPDCDSTGWVKFVPSAACPEEWLPQACAGICKPDKLGLPKVSDFHWSSFDLLSILRLACVPPHLSLFQQ